MPLKYLFYLMTVQSTVWVLGGSELGDRGGNILTNGSNASSPS